MEAWTVLAKNLNCNLLELVSRDLKGSRFEGEALAILTQYLQSGERFPLLSEHVIEQIDAQKGVGFEKKEAAFTFIDLFAGLGGFRLGLESIGGKAVFSSEWESKAKEYYHRNHGEYPFGDIALFTSEDMSDNELGALIPSHDILAAGFPCQPFSRAGVSARNAIGKPHGFDCETQGTLFYSIERVAKVKQPKVLFLENVRNIISHDQGTTFAVIRKTIEDLGYGFFHKIVNSETLVPQRRNRCFMVCVRNDVLEKLGGFDFPDFSGEPLKLKSILESDPNPTYTISEKLWNGHVKRTSRNLKRGTGFTAHLADVERPSNTIVARYGKDGKECLIGQDGKCPRMLTISECRDLFGYPKDFQLPETKTNAYRLLGNSVVVPVVEKISKVIAARYL